MSGDSVALWAIVVLVGVANYLSRLSFIAIFSRTPIPPLVARALRYVAVAMLTALVLPMVLAPRGGAFDWTGPRVPATALAFVVAYFTRSTGWTLASGMAVLWLLQALV